MLGHLSLPSALRGDLLDPASPTGQAEQPRSPLRYVSCAAGVGADRSARSCKWAVPGDLPGVVRRTRENQRTPPLHRVGAATRRQRTPEATQRQTSSKGRASGLSPALHDLLRVSTELAARSHTGSDPCAAEIRNASRTGVFRTSPAGEALARRHWSSLGLLGRQGSRTWQSRKVTYIA